MSNRTIFLIDGFNLYHSIIDIARLHDNICLKWLDIHSLCSSYLPLVGNGASLEQVYYFSALADHLGDPQIVNRHRTYIKCLEATGIMKEMGRFKARHIKCKICGTWFKRYEEKETDVAIATKLFEILANNLCESVVLVTGDTDLAPAVRSAQGMFSKANILFAFPFGRKNAQLQQMAPNSFKLNKKNYQRHQFPDPFLIADGTAVAKPASW